MYKTKRAWKKCFESKEQLLRGWGLGLALVAGLICNACTTYLDPSKDPKKSLSDYISQSFSIKSVDDKPRLLAFLTGDVKARLGSWSEDQFRAAFIDSKRDFIKLAFKEVKDVSPAEVQITYELTYTDQGKVQDGRKHEVKVTNKKLCQLVLEQGKWRISDVKNIKELIEYKNELSLP